MITFEISDHDSSRVVVDYKEFEVDLLKKIPGISYLKKTGTTFPKSWATYVIASGVIGDELQCGPEYAAWLNEEYASRVKPCLDLRLLTDVDAEGFDARLRPFQRAGVAFMSIAQRVLLADDLGAGKTVQSIMTLKRLHEHGHNVFPILTITLPSIKGQWEDEYNKWWPELNVVRVRGTATQRRKALESDADVYIMNWESLRLHTRLAAIPGQAMKKCKEHKGDEKVTPAQCEAHLKELNDIPFRSIIADEAHNMKGVSAKKTRATIALMHGPDVKYKIALTGTPIGESVVDLWPIMYSLRPEEYPVKSKFVERYGQEKFNYFSKQTEITGLNPYTKHEFLQFFDPSFRRMPKELVLKDLPPIVHYTYEAEMSTKQAKAYKELQDDMFTRTDSGDLILTTNNMTQHLRLLQNASATIDVDKETGEIIMVDPSPKIDVLLDIIDQTKGIVVVAAESRKLIELAAKRLAKNNIPHGLIVGGMTEDQRTAVLRGLNDGQYKVVLFTMKAGGTGANMTAADTIVFLERSWSMIQNVQTLGRVHRIGSEVHESINHIDVIAPGTVEESQLRKVQEKFNRLQEINRDRETIRDVEQLQAFAEEEQRIINSEIIPEI